jgi:aminocarboxymuconate-semialdehyde decarboxylase
MRRASVPGPAQCDHNAPPDIGVTAARLMNEGIAAMAAKLPNRMPAAMGSVPFQAGGEAAAAELQYRHETLGREGVEVLAHVGDQELSDVSFEPLWAKAAELLSEENLRRQDCYFTNPNGGLN